MANYSVSADQLTEGEVVLIRGKLGFARLTRLIDGAELQASDVRRAQNGMNPVGKPHTTATITQAEVVPKDPASPTIEEQFVAERRYSSKKHPETGLNYSIDSKGQTLPVIAIPTDTAGQVMQDDSGHELASGLDVTLVMRVYKPKGYSNRGLSLDQVIVNEPVRYYTSNANTEELAARGIVFAVPPQPIPARQGAVNDQSSQPAAAPEGTVIDENGFALPAPAGVPVPQPQEAQPAQAPTAQPAPVAQPRAPQVQAAPIQQGAVPPPTAAPAVPQEESMEDKLARLMAENESLRNAGSAVGAPPAPAGPDNPWEDSPAAQQAGITPGR
ncbi:hypothetical protein ACFOY4_01580 [Actinomadura syzygii]|uniref:Uncharacterized protein n=2 Tax=Actinomadura syzygii TaxID=1427538 RepID=A0A5D0TS83_9ACTN|nr:hypothetical protein [Actinomadura syzygii]TYC08563.1 hypothetical protein FXF65_37345 [Actinomadura syzygii]